MDTFFHSLLENNKKWVTQKLQEDAQYFDKLAKGQKPPILWIGCADSRVPANEITGTQPGDIFVHRNIANMVLHTDMNMLSVLDYAVNVLLVNHVIVCGHYGCGGVAAALQPTQQGLIDNWIRHIRDVYRFHQIELDSIHDPLARVNRFVEVNVIEQVSDLGKTSIIQNAWKERSAPQLHGWVFDLHSGFIKDMKVNVEDNAQLQNIDLGRTVATTQD